MGVLELYRVVKKVDEDEVKLLKKVNKSVRNLSYSKFSSRGFIM